MLLLISVNDSQVSTIHTNFCCHPYLHCSWKFYCRSETMSRFIPTHKFFANYILLAQFFGAFPICGITNARYSKLKFKWRTFRTCYSMLLICFSLFNSSFEVYYYVLSSSSRTLGKISEKLFSICAYLTDSYFNSTDILRNYMHFPQCVTVPFGHAMASNYGEMAKSGCTYTSI